MNVIKKTVVILFVSILAACSTDQEIFEEQNIPVESSLRTQERNSIIKVVIQFKEDISKTKREEIRDRLISQDIIIGYDIISHDYGIEILYVLCDNAEQCVLEMGKACPCITPLGDLEDDGVLDILDLNIGNDQGQN